MTQCFKKKFFSWRLSLELFSSSSYNKMAIKVRSAHKLAFRELVTGLRVLVQSVKRISTCVGISRLRNILEQIFFKIDIAHMITIQGCHFLKNVENKGKLERFVFVQDKIGEYRWNLRKFGKFYSMVRQLHRVVFFWKKVGELEKVREIGLSRKCSAILIKFDKTLGIFN